MTSQGGGTLLNNQDDLLAGLENNPASATYQTEDNTNYFDYLSSHDNVSDAQAQVPSNPSDITLTLPQQNRIRQRWEQTQRLTNDITQVFLNGVHTTSHQHQGTQLVPSGNQPWRFQQWFSQNDHDVALQTAQEEPVVGGTLLSNVGASFDANIVQHNPTFGVLPDIGHESSHSHLNVLAAPFLPPPCASDRPASSEGQNQIPQVTDWAQQDIERDVGYQPPSRDYTWTWSSPYSQNNNVGSIDEATTAMSHNNPFALSGDSSGPFFPRPHRQDVATVSSAQLALNDPYTQSIGIDLVFMTETHNSPQPTTEPSRVSTAQHGYSSPILTPQSSVRQSRSIHSRTTGRGPGRAPSLCRSTSAQTSFSHESNGSAPSKRGKRNGPMDPRRNRRAQETRMLQSVCADCKLRKVQVCH
ncbi:uncharacterized protein MAM_01388 [Metarhizium album ARSEF 1941]|uniref:Uncharacterized protein n=1 Tax=Metarhizium album (strain ARSEF 1941) TaxID=1081103 RepID=A0A0B2X580_METAS|nr:uncharacterized protein MAM_01388 [Metarhizium album ARSEF 1941]KHO00610.1 hypothetical protein MAM_01388 [Metarhizium album ARSEF 1941]